MRFIAKSLLLTGLALTLAAPVRAADFDSYLPNDSEVVVSINVEQLLNSALGKKYLRGALEQALKDNPQAQDILKALNFDVFKDLTRVTLAMKGTDKDDALGIISGKFDRTKVEAALAQAAADQPDKVKIHKAGSTTIYEMIGDDKKPAFGAFASSTIILFAPKLESLKTAVGGSGLGKPKKELTAMFPKTGKATAWPAALPKITSAVPLPSDNPDMKKAIEGLEGIIGTLTIDTNAALSITLNSKNAQATQALGQQLIAGLNFLKAAGPGLAKDKPELAPLMELANTIKIVPKQKGLTISAELSGTAIEKLIEQAKKDK